MSSRPGKPTGRATAKAAQRKRKQILMVLASGASQAEAAWRNKVSRQYVSAVVKREWRAYQERLMVGRLREGA